MPRGVYQRKKSTTNGAEKTAAAKPAKITKSGKPRRRRRTKAEMQAARAAESTVKKTGRGRKKNPAVATSSVATEMTVTEQFAVVRENVVALSQVRNNLAGRAGQDTKTIDEELAKELELMGVLRQRHFGNVEAGTVDAQETASGDNGVQQIPLPPSPPPQLIPTPPRQ